LDLLKQLMVPDGLAVSLYGQAPAGGDDLALPACPVVDDLGARDRQGVVRVDVVEVAEAEQNVVDRLLGVLGLEARDEQRQAFVGGPPGSLLDGHQVEIVAEQARPAEVPDRIAELLLKHLDDRARVIEVDALRRRHRREMIEDLGGHEGAG
jgi:hypothetical protein